MKPEPARQGVMRLRSVGEFGEDTDLDGAEQGLRGPEGKAGLQDPLGRNWVGHVSLLDGLADWRMMPQPPHLREARSVGRPGYRGAHVKSRVCDGTLHS